MKYTYSVFALIFFTYNVCARKPNLEKISIYSNKFIHNFHLFESSFTWLVRILLKDLHTYNIKFNENI